MAGDWIKMRKNLQEFPEVARIAIDLNMDIPRVVYGLYLICGWLDTHGKHGKIDAAFEHALNFVFGAGVTPTLRKVGWLREYNGVLLISGFTKAHQERKSLGRKVRHAVLADGKCYACGSSEELQVDHNIPIARGGSSNIENLVPLCRKCNIAKGTKTLQEFME